MNVKDKAIGQTVSVADVRCPRCACYWPRPDPGTFTQGQGYRSRPGKRQWICGTREIRGCPYNKVCEMCGDKNAAYETKCRGCKHTLGEEYVI